MSGRQREVSENIAAGVASRILEPGSPMERAWARISQERREELIEEATEFVEAVLGNYARDVARGD